MTKTEDKNPRKSFKPFRARKFKMGQEIHFDRRNFGTNLEHDAMTDDMIDTSDIPPLTDDFFATAKWRMPKPKVKVMVEIEPEVLDWFKAQGGDWKHQVSAAIQQHAHTRKN